MESILQFLFGFCQDNLKRILHIVPKIVSLVKREFNSLQY